VPELKLTQDYLLDTLIILNPERAKRPHQFSYSSADSSNSKEMETCPFCPGNEHLTPEEHLRIEDGLGKWIVRIFSNKYKIWKIHDVIVDTPLHSKDWEDMDSLLPLFQAIKLRIRNIYEKHPEVKWISLFKNYGKMAGASIKHSHLQLIALDFIPFKIEKIVKKLAISNCAICKKLWKEGIIIKETNFFRSLFVASAHPYEIEIHPKIHRISLEFLTEDELNELNRFLKGIIKTFKMFFKDYNVLFFLAPKNKDFHFFIRIFPRITVYAGFEFESGIIVNPVPPEKAFEFLGKELLKNLNEV